MPKSITATSVALEAVQVGRDEGGQVTSLTAVLNIAYGESHVREEYDLWTALSPEQRQAMQDIYETLIQRAQAEYLA